ncbi:cytochrome c oxidase cbb3-type subunit 3 [Stella humosa]|uniref:Cbb3-type cytochrome c oxidase subunit n=1 Tax=Stella humosa TaxID=94 RepID=A0A3N1KVK0_9PROT|nr:cytochrome-c oxidase, cbb3-type subunit III [Stella humosa]ROP81345.1 cytochrome c oxidase cbb3-type subunit 3 [Stella humosa]BBK32695.1 Cbb3-type cytochrome c oxidase subunit FixP [Stella humosa]
MPTKIEKDAVTGRSTTGHEWDGIKELNTPLPRWWLYVFYACIAWSVGYYVFYPSLPWVHGVLGWSRRAELAETMQAERERIRPMLERIRATPIAAVDRSPELRDFAFAGGRAAFADNCAPCHGAGGAGAKGGFPALVDDEWIWGGDLAAIERTILYGVRSSHPDTRASQMPRFGADQILTAAQIADTAEHVLSLSGRSTDGAAAARGSAIFADNCAACHGPAGRGNVELGSPDLADRIWLFGSDKAAIAHSIHLGRGGVMPAWNTRLDEATIKMLTVYVHSLGGGR